MREIRPSGSEGGAGFNPWSLPLLAEEKRKLPEQQQLKASEVQKVIAAREQAVRGELKPRLAAMSKQCAAATARLAEVLVDQADLTERIVMLSTRKNGSQWAPFVTRIIDEAESS
jgi:hypothetical protein